MGGGVAFLFRLTFLQRRDLITKHQFAFDQRFNRYSQLSLPQSRLQGVLRSCSDSLADMPCNEHSSTAAPPRSVLCCNCDWVLEQVETVGGQKARLLRLSGTCRCVFLIKSLRCKSWEEEAHLLAVPALGATLLRKPRAAG